MAVTSAQGTLVPSLYAPTVAALAATGAKPLPIATSAWVATTADIWLLQPSAIPVDNITVVNAAGRTGFQWVRQPRSANPLWAVQTTWTVDPQNVAAGDENAGTSGSPLKTLTEVSRRLAGATIPAGTLITINLLSDCVNTDKPVWTFNVQPGSSGDGIIIVGTPSAPIYTGSLTSPYVQQVQGNTATATDNEITDSAIPVSYTASGLVASGLIYTRTNGTPLFWFPLKDLGAKTLRITDAMTGSTTAPVITTLVNGDTYTVRRLPKIFDQLFPTSEVSARNARVILQLVDDNSTGSTSQLNAVSRAPVTYDRCTVATAHVWASVTFMNSFIWAVCSIQPQGFGFWRGGGVAGGVSSFLVQSGSILNTSLSGPTHFQGAQLSLSVQSILAGAINCFYDNTTDALTALVQSQISFNVIKGTGNTAKLIHVHSGSQAFYSTSPPAVAGSSSDGSPMQAAGTSVAVAALPLTATIGTDMACIQFNT